MNNKSEYSGRILITARSMIRAIILALLPNFPSHKYPEIKASAKANTFILPPWTSGILRMLIFHNKAITNAPKREILSSVDNNRNNPTTDNKDAINLT
jgi:hypothetical protein